MVPHLQAENSMPSTVVAATVVVAVWGVVTGAAVVGGIVASAPALLGPHLVLTDSFLLESSAKSSIK